jgi:hypothetical protein
MEQFLSFTLVGACCPLLLFHPFVDGSFKLCNNGLCTYSDVEAEFNYPISKKYPVRPQPSASRPTKVPNKRTQRSLKDHSSHTTTPPPGKTKAEHKCYKAFVHSGRTQGTSPDLLGA